MRSITYASFVHSSRGVTAMGIERKRAITDSRAPELRSVVLEPGPSLP